MINDLNGSKEIYLDLNRAKGKTGI